MASRGLAGIVPKMRYAAARCPGVLDVDACASRCNLKIVSTRIYIMVKRSYGLMGHGKGRYGRSLCGFERGKCFVG